ncbi:MAG: hypothetical protein O2821_06400 [Chloroflexi bacterium]|nr:hypothetical protein [Chloroflexota bacterium]
MKRVFGSIPIIAVLVLLFGVVFNIVEQPQTALAVSPVITVYMDNPVPGADASTDHATDGIPDVETDWGKTGTVLWVEVQSGGLSAGAELRGADVTISTKESDITLTTRRIAEDDFGTDDGLIVFEIELTEASSTSPVSGDYVGAADRFKIQVDSDDEVTIVVKPSTGDTIDVAKSVTIGVENTDPKVRNVLPEDGDVVDDEDVDIEFSITDRGAGIPDPEDKPDTDGDNEYSATVILISDVQCTVTEITTGITSGGIDAGSTTCSGGSAITVITVDDENDYDDITDGFDVGTNAFLDENETHFMTVVTFDAAGNFDIYDGEDDSSTDTMLELTVDTEDPVLNSTFPPRTGVSYDSADDEFSDDRGWIQVIIVDNTDLDADTIDEDDFVVEGHTIRRVQWFDVDPSEIEGGPDSGTPHADGPEDIDGTRPATCFAADGSATAACTVTTAKIERPDSWFPTGGNPNVTPAVPDENGRFMLRNSVFIQLEDDLDPDETPDINIVPDGIDDEAGNNLDSDDEEAEDRISPEFKIESIGGPNSPDLVVGENQEIEIFFTADEAIESDPTVTVTLVIDGALTNVGSTLNTDVDETGTNRWKVIIDEPNNTGYYNIWISGEDDQGNDGEVDGAIDPTASDGLTDFFDGDGDVDDGAVFFQGDIAMPDPKVNIDGLEVEVDEDTFEFEDPFFIQILFDENANNTSGNNNENKEYSQDKFDDVVITSFLLDGVDLTDLVSSTDDQRFLVAIENISIGDHTIKINAVDQAGNELDEILELDFEVEERDPFERTLNPGWNLISVPADPNDPSIDVVLGPDVPVTTVYTFDPTVPGGWLVAVRETSDDSWVGDLREITSRRGYWIRADQIEDWEVDIPRLPGGAVSGGTPIQPPLIDLFPGWNLVPIVDVTGEALDADSFVDADDYFESSRDEIARILAFDTIQNEWSTIPFGDDAIDSDSSDGDATIPDDLDDLDIPFGDAVWVFATEASTLVPGGKVLK